MDSLRTHCAPLRRIIRRQGMIAVQEVILLVALLVVLAWMIPRVLAIGSKIATAADVTSPRWVTRLSLHPEGHRMSLFRPREGYFMVDLTTGEKERSLPFLPAEFIALSFSSDGTTVLLCDLDGAISIYHDGEEAALGRTKFEVDTFIYAIVAEDGSFAACVTSEGRIDGWRKHGSKFREITYELESSPAIQFVCVNATGSRLCVIRTDGSVTFHSSETGILQGPRLNVGSTNVAADWSRDEQTIAVINLDSVVGFYDAATGQKIREGSLDDQSRHCDFAVVRISPDGQWIAGATNVTSHISLWNVSMGTVGGQLCGHRGMIRTMQFSPDSHRFYSGSYDGSVREWSLETFSQVRIVD